MAEKYCSICEKWFNSLGYARHRSGKKHQEKRRSMAETLIKTIKV